MDNRFEQYWRASAYRPRLRYKLIGSVAVHAALAGLLLGWLNLRWEPDPPKVYEVQIVQASEMVSDTPTKEVVEPPTPEPTPEPAPKLPPEPTPEPEPKKVETPKPAPKKPAPKPKPPEEKEPPKPKPPEKKPEPKPKPKPKPPEKKPEKKPPPKKKDPPQKKTPPKPAKNQGELTQGVEEAKLPNALRGWAALVQRKVDRNWVVPGGISLGEEGETVKVGFYVTSNGDLLEDPIILEGTSQKVLDSSCLNAVKAALPLPPFPNGFNEPEQYVVYVFKTTP